MWNPLANDRMRSDALALQAIAERAGCALGCAYSTTDEFEEAVIRARRLGFIATHRWHLRQALCLAGLAAALAIIIRLI
jgi:hypothetical protein